MDRQDVDRGDEGRKLTAAWLNIVAAGIVSTGIVPLLNTLVMGDSRGMDLENLALLAATSASLGAVVHLIGRFLVRPRSGTRG